MKIFISYRREDSASITGRIYDRLVAAFGYPVIFKDVDSIPYGVDFRQHIDGAIRQCSVVLVIIGREWLIARDEYGVVRLNSPHDFVRIELESALQQRVYIIPVFVSGISSIPVNQLPISIQNLAYINGIHVREDPDFHGDMNRLINRLSQIIPPAGASSQLSPSTPISYATQHVEKQKPKRKSRWAIWVAVIIVLLSCICYPIYSFNWLQFGF